MIKRIKPKKLRDICEEWDSVNSKRQQVIEQGKDISLFTVTSPCILKSIVEDSPQKVLDVGCGSGYLTAKIAEKVDECIGIDLSEKSITLARQKYQRKNLSFVNSEISKYVPESKIDACVANMVFMSDPEWIQSIKHIYNILDWNGYFYVMITHPCFWPKYWNYQDEEWFCYNEEIYIENNFSVSLEKTMGKTTYIHRSLEQYINGLIKAGFGIEKIEEPYPSMPIPEGYSYSYPRFLFIKCRKQ